MYQNYFGWGYIHVPISAYILPYACATYTSTKKGADQVKSHKAIIIARLFLGGAS